MKKTPLMDFIAKAVGWAEPHVDLDFNLEN